MFRSEGCLIQDSKLNTQVATPVWLASPEAFVEAVQKVVSAMKTPAWAASPRSLAETDQSTKIPPWLAAPQAFAEAVQKVAVGTDKCSTAGNNQSAHSYQGTYWDLFFRFHHMGINAPKIFEIGLGCGMPNGVGGSAKMWKAFLPKSAVFIFEFDRVCAKNWTSENPGVASVFVGDQRKSADLEAAVRQTGVERFDLIVDDGGHQNEGMSNSLRTLWPYVKPGGSYVVEDSSVNCYEIWGGSEGCLLTKEGGDTFLGKVLKYQLPVVLKSPWEDPPELPGLESISFHHELVEYRRRLEKPYSFSKE